MRKPIVVAFLQCQWIKPESVDRVKKIYEGRTPERRAKLNARYLFYKSLTGRRLKAAFGDLCDVIVWEEVSKEIASVSSGSFPPDFQHIKGVTDFFAPQIILTFGAIATGALEKFYAGCDSYPFIIAGPHPAARHATVIENLESMAKCLRRQFEPVSPAGV